MRINLSVRSARPPMTKKEAGSWLNRLPPLQELVDLWDSLETCTWMLCSSDEEIRPAMYTHPLISGALKYVTWCVYVTHYRFHFCRKGLGCTGILLVREGEINFSCRALLFEGPLNLKLKQDIDDPERRLNIHTIICSKVHLCVDSPQQVANFSDGLDYTHKFS